MREGYVKRRSRGYSAKQYPMSGNDDGFKSGNMLRIGFGVMKITDNVRKVVWNAFYNSRHECILSRVIVFGEVVSRAEIRHITDSAVIIKFRQDFAEDY